MDARLILTIAAGTASTVAYFGSRLLVSRFLDRLEAEVQELDREC